jgi:exopolysaccharide biosynthesis polyprenyl glycosylphosphotransferase
MSPFTRRDLRLLALLGDLLALAFAFNAAATLRLALNPLFEKQLSEAQMEYLVPPLGLVLLLWAVAGAWTGLYRPRRRPFMFSAAVQALEAMALVVVLTIVVAFFVRDLGRDYSRSFIIFLVALGGVALLANRALLSFGFVVASRRGLVRERILLVGAGQGASSLIHRLEAAERRRIEICGVVTPAVGLGAGVLGNPVPIVGTVDELPALINRYRIDRVIAVEKEIPPEQMQSCISVCTRMGVPFNHTAGRLERTALRVGVTELANVLLIEVRGLEFTRLQQAVKRAFDLLVATSLLALLAPLLAVLALAVRLTSSGPVLYVAPRVGRGGRHFRFFKFRTMVRGADAQRDAFAACNEQKGHLFKIHRDPRVTAAGRLMRRLSLDELPQLLNVLRGEMSLVGPRPLPARDLEPDGLSREYRVWAVQRTKVPPGITGLWQIRGRSDLGFEEMLRLDIAYVRHWSIWLDMKILAQTFPAALRGRGAC